MIKKTFSRTFTENQQNRDNFTGGFNGSKASKRFSYSKEAFKVWGWKMGMGAGAGAVFERQCKLLKCVRSKTLSVNFSLDYENNQVNFKDEANFRDAVQ